MKIKTYKHQEKTYKLEQFSNNELIAVFPNDGYYCVSLWLCSDNTHTYHIHNIETGSRLNKSYSDKVNADLLAFALNNGLKQNSESFVSIVSAAIKGLTMAILFILLSFNLQAQQVVKMDAKGNYTAVQKSGSKAGSKAVATGKTYTDNKGVSYPVMRSERGKLFYTRISAKSQKSYNVYISLTSKN